MGIQYVVHDVPPILGRPGKVVGIRRDFRRRVDRLDVLSGKGGRGKRRGGKSEAVEKLEWSVVPVTNITSGQKRLE